MRERFLQLLHRYGETLTAGEDELRAFVQPLRRKGEQGYGSVPAAYGTLPLNEFLYLGEPEVKLREGMRLLWQGKALRVAQAREVYVAGVCVYLWAVLREVNA